MDRKLALTVITVALAGVLLIAVATAGDVGIVGGPPQISWDPHLDTTQLQTPDSLPAPPPPIDDTQGGGAQLPQALVDAIQVVVLGLVIVLAVLLAGYAWSNRPRLRWRRTRPSDDFDVLDDVAASMAADAAVQHATLLRGAPRNAIVECWLRLEAAVAGAGLRRDTADTSAEFTARVLSRFAIDPSAIGELSSLYREARFSTHPMDEASRTRAIAALEAVHHGLRHPDRRDPDDVVAVCAP